MSINKKAIEMFEKNEYDYAMRLFKKAVKKSSEVQSLNNLAWMYCYEEGKFEEAAKLLEETIKLNPTSHFPYILLGEVYAHLEKWDKTKEMLDIGIAMEPVKTAYNSLAFANYHLGFIKAASEYFLLASEDSDYEMYSHVKCLIELGKEKEAKVKLDGFSCDAEDFVGEIDVADLYVEMGFFKEAVNWFENGWDDYWKEPSWISRYVYSLIKLGDLANANKVLGVAIDEKNVEIKEAIEEVCYEYWSEEEKAILVNQLLLEKKEYEGMLEKIVSGVVPAMEFNTNLRKECYLFGCARHNHAEYQK
ncbi:tetratricopeptide repeat protein [Viridibacillus arvi]|uniref:tetratricopeptide repeat protein n=1 Tax=Viridibacillus arvi TaxID=263475 RepID=UPI003CFE9A9C